MHRATDLTDMINFVSIIERSMRIKMNVMIS